MSRRSHARRDEQLSLMGDAPPRPHGRVARAPEGPPRHPGPRFGEQVELFAPVVQVEALDPRTVIGERTRVRGLWRVRVDGGEAHLVFHDRHGRYCQAHGAECPAVGVLERSERSGE